MPTLERRASAAAVPQATTRQRIQRFPDPRESIRTQTKSRAALRPAHSSSFSSLRTFSGSADVEMTYFSEAQFPRSSRRHRSEQNGISGSSSPTALPQIGQGTRFAVLIRQRSSGNAHQATRGRELSGRLPVKMGNNSPRGTEGEDAST